MLSQFMQDPKKKHVQATHKLLEYIHGTPGKGILFKASEDTIIRGYADADWTRDVNNRKSTSGYYCFMGNNLVN